MHGRPRSLNMGTTLGTTLPSRTRNHPRNHPQGKRRKASNRAWEPPPEPPGTTVVGTVGTTGSPYRGTGFHTRTPTVLG